MAHRPETTIETLRPDQLADVARVRDNPRYKLQPTRRKVLVRLRLIRPIEPPRAPGETRRDPPVRAHEVTPLGIAALDRLVEIPPPDPLRVPPHTGYVADSVKRRGVG